VTAVLCHQRVVNTYNIMILTMLQSTIIPASNVTPNAFVLMTLCYYCQ